MHIYDLSTWFFSFKKQDSSPNIEMSWDIWEQMLYLLRREGAEDNTKRLRKSPLVSERKEEDGDEENKQLCVNI